jgi:hypothetical protein
LSVFFGDFGRGYGFKVLLPNGVTVFAGEFLTLLVHFSPYAASKVHGTLVMFNILCKNCNYYEHYQDKKRREVANKKFCSLTFIWRTVIARSPEGNMLRISFRVTQTVNLLVSRLQYGWYDRVRPLNARGCKCIFILLPRPYWGTHTFYISLFLWLWRTALKVFAMLIIITSWRLGNRGDTCVTYC